MLYKKPLASCRSPTALKKLDRSKQCHCLQVAKCLLYCFRIDEITKREFNLLFKKSIVTSIMPTQNQLVENEYENQKLIKSKKFINS